MHLVTSIDEFQRFIARIPLICVLVLISVPAWLADRGPNYSLMIELAEARYGADGTRAVSDWRNIIENTIPSVDTQLNGVNRFFNRRIGFDSDINIWKDKDYWATPLQTLGRGQGDCEDFSIAKYMTLLVMGIPAQQLRLVYVKASVGGSSSGISQAHMVLAFYPEPNSEPLILDNLIDDILPAGQRSDLKPVYSFNTDGLWVAGKVIAQPEQRLSRWRDVLARMQEEGL